MINAAVYSLFDYFAQQWALRLVNKISVSVITFACITLIPSQSIFVNFNLTGSLRILVLDVNDATKKYAL